MKLRLLWLLPLLIATAGCGSETKDESEAYKALEAKPMTEEQKAQLEKVKSSVPNADAAHAGATSG
ncbi:hypothetical protein EON81_11965 [bacterium]|nr:MAG: hypothetical protein EON81_11965 [bacterium]